MILSFFPCHTRKETATRPVMGRRGREKERGLPAVTWRRRRKASQDGWWSASDPRVAVHGASSRRTVSHRFQPVGCSQSVLDKQLRSRGRTVRLSRFSPLEFAQDFIQKFLFFFTCLPEIALLIFVSATRSFHSTREIFGVARELSSKCAECLDIECWMKTLVWYISDKVSAARGFEEVLERALVGDILEEATETWLRMVNVSIVLSWEYVQENAVILISNFLH